ncbi:bifunctional DNA-formamidopyrimidine glycosylase/DNA-(apurinic or apyrimidinic site) lyase [Kordiimonas pumila]|uniref:Formamidopyrimidine-DNA glycosylase n=1 Tax=Kordiimonas pumila TaxID=2161677 RepID=A0ABV7D4X8_9PROT|nr:bifunctional DNA-formamidopyrimidine glycosylase/DNA-(apurinic or apyrimidinic site) lyase [Kordiimonas pumila]
MPELPEVETVRRGLLPVLEGATIRTAVARRANLRFPIPNDFTKRLEGNRITGLRRRSKYILIDCEDRLVVIVHLGMSGRVTIYKGTEPDTIGKHDHISLITENGDHILYTDPRRFGLWTFTTADAVETHPLLINIGPEPLGNSFNSNVLKTAFSGKKSPIKAALLDQRSVAGLGNIYVCEALWRAGIHPEKQAGHLTSAEIEALVPIIRDVLTKAIEAGGSSLKDYTQANGELGYFQHSFQAYDREGTKCYKEGCGGTIMRIIQSNRSTFYCPTCQH